MWMCVVTRCAAGGVVVLLLNSFIHTVMYTYYVAAAMGYRSPLKHYLTQAQLIQFFIGVGVTVYCYFMDGCLNAAQTLCLFLFHLYVIILVYLFGLFYYESYVAVKGKDKKK